jgi:hypothetical protein
MPTRGTAGFFFISFSGHWLFGWFSYVEEQRQHAKPVEVSSYIVEMSRDTLENWQSEVLQLLWQVGGLALLLYVGSPQSSEGDSRQRRKARCYFAVAPVEAEKTIRER